MTTYIYNMGLRFKAVAREQAQRTALLFAGAPGMDFATLDAASDRAAVHLLARGLGPGKVVALWADKCPMAYVVLLAALKIGAPYLALDTKSPLARQEKILALAQPSLIVAEEEVAYESVPVCRFDALQMPAGPLEPAALARVTGATPAYLMFTSGSTGFPKGVTISHAGMLNLCHWARDTFSITPDDRLSHVNPLYFDNSVFDIAASLFNGASLAVAGRDLLNEPLALVKFTATCSLWFSVPSLLIYLSTLRALTGESWPDMRAILFGGEGFAKAELGKLYGLYGQQAALWNIYGPTECTCICSSYRITQEDIADLTTLAPLGLLAPNFSGYVMGEDGAAEMPDGETGELYLCGPQVALGYYNDPERSLAAFAPNPLQPAYAEPCYRTGDRVWRDPATGYYHFAGRQDNQIKHMGYRIELEEIESALHALPDISQSAVIYRRQGQGGSIIAFVAASGALEGYALKSRLREALPAYMIPQTIRFMETLPRNANGKIDRKALEREYGETHG